MDRGYSNKLAAASNMFSGNMDKNFATTIGAYDYTDSSMASIERL
jgi:hypothetical protein